ncbi:MAG: ribosomal-protein-alanine N-acetyltransferase [Rhodospirillaceae bacterium]|nr:MAG: ribosomal-protein-alanine N-acetyltransferase [Rhodospirillaceae bacterium]
MSNKRVKPVAGLQVVAATVSDAALLAQLHATSFPAPWTEEDFALFLRQPGMAAWAAGYENPSGFILVRSAGEEAEILTIAVAPPARRHGVGRILLRHAQEQLRGLGVASLFLEVATNNQAALGLYNVLGFVVCGKRRNYYRNTVNASGNDATVMRCDL